MKLQSIKNKLYERMDMKVGMCGRIYIDEAIKQAYECGKQDALNIKEVSE